VYRQPGEPIWQLFGLDQDRNLIGWSGTVANTTSKLFYNMLIQVGIQVSFKVGSQAVSEVPAGYSGDSVCVRYWYKSQSVKTSIGFSLAACGILFYSQIYTTV